MNISHILLCVFLSTFVGSARSQWEALLDVAEDAERGMVGAADAAEGAETVENAENVAEVGHEAEIGDEAGFSESTGQARQTETADEIQQDKKELGKEEKKEQIQLYEEEEKQFEDQAKTDEGEDKEVDEEIAESAKELVEKAKDQLEDAMSDSESTSTAKDGLAHGYYYNRMEALRKKYADRLSNFVDRDTSTINPFLAPIKHVEGISYTESSSADVYNSNGVLNSNSYHERSSTSNNRRMAAGIAAGVILAFIIVALKVFVCVKKCDNKAVNSAHPNTSRVVSPGRTRTVCRALSVTALNAVPTGPNSDRVNLIGVRQTRIVHV